MGGEGSPDSSTSRFHGASHAPPRLREDEMTFWETIKDFCFGGSDNKKFGTWDGVFMTVTTNLIGVILFSRMGYIVGNTGIWEGLALIAVTVIMSLCTILSTAGICATCHLTKGGVYAIVKQALGTQIGGTIGLVYVTGLAIVNAVFILGFAEALIDICNWTGNFKNYITVGLVAEFVLLFVCLAGVSWIIKLQMFLLLMLIISIFNFVIGGFVLPSFNQHISENSGSDFLNGEDWFSLFALFFAGTTGIMSGANMSGDLRTPSVSIPVGTIFGILATNVVYLLFLLILASYASRAELLTDYLIAKEAGTEVLFFIGLFIASLSSSFGVFIGAPRVLQGIGEDIPVFGIKQFGIGFGKDAEPIRATFLVAVITACFIIIGDLNTVASIMTAVLLLTYGFINYAYFALATGGLREEAEAKQREMLETMEMDTVPDTPKRMQVSFEPPPKWVLMITNRWVSLLMFVWHIVVMFVIRWEFGLAVLGASVIFYFYIGFMNKDHNKVGDADFSFREWINPLHHPSRKGQRERYVSESTTGGRSSVGPASAQSDVYGNDKYSPAESEL